jgi:hypothetical protein
MYSQHYLVIVIKLQCFNIYRIQKWPCHIFIRGDLDGKKNERKEEKMSANCNEINGFHVFSYSNVSPVSNLVIPHTMQHVHKYIYAEKRNKWDLDTACRSPV